jgi:hypothetical protein
MFMTEKEVSDYLYVITKVWFQHTVMYPAGVTSCAKFKNPPKAVLELAYMTTVVLLAQNKHPPKGVLNFCATR